jgi:putative transposase
MISRAHKIKLKPNKAQAVMLSKTAGTARYAYNWALAETYKGWKETGKSPSVYELANRWTAEKPEWASETARTSQTRAILNTKSSYKKFIENLKAGVYAGKQVVHPSFKRKGVHDSFYVDNAHAKLCGKHIKLPKVGSVRMRESLRYSDCKIMSYTISCEAGEWYASVQVEMDEEVRSSSNSFVGVDVGCKSLAVASDGTECKTPGMLKDLERQLKRKQRLLARKAKGSKNRVKARFAVARAYQRIRNVKQDAVHKFTAAIAKNHGVVVIEDLDVKSMQENADKRTRKGVHNSCMSEVHRQLMYKCNSYIKVDRYFPSSKTCSNCGFHKADLLLGDRTFVCPSCGLTINRDLNAALNLLHEGIRIYTEGHSGSACGEVDGTSVKQEVLL